MKTIIKIVVFLLILLLSNGNINAAVNDPISEIFPDDNMALAVADHLGKNINDPLTQNDVDNTLDLNVSSKNISSISGIEVFDRLRNFNASNNNLTSLPNEITTITSLLELEVNNNNLTSLPSNIGDLTNLLGLNVSSNKLTSLPNSLTQLNGLINLRISNNQIIDLPTSLANFINDPIQTYVMINQNSITNSGDYPIGSNSITSLPIQEQITTYNQIPEVTYTLTNPLNINTVVMPEIINGKILIDYNLVNMLGSYTLTTRINNDVNLLFLDDSTYIQEFNIVDAITITLNGDNPMYLKVGETFVDPGATATNSLGEELVVTNTGAVDSNKIGKYYITYSASNQTSTVSKIREVVVTGDDVAVGDKETLLQTGNKSLIMVMLTLLFLIAGIKKL